MLFARDGSQIEFDYEGERWVALLKDGQAYVYNKDRPGRFGTTVDCAHKWFIENQAQFNLEGYV